MLAEACLMVDENLNNNGWQIKRLRYYPPRFHCASFRVQASLLHFLPLVLLGPVARLQARHLYFHFVESALLVQVSSLKLVALVLQYPHYVRIGYKGPRPASRSCSTHKAVLKRSHFRLSILQPNNIQAVSVIIRPFWWSSLRTIDRCEFFSAHTLMIPLVRGWKVTACANQDLQAFVLVWYTVSKPSADGLCTSLQLCGLVKGDSIALTNWSKFFIGRVHHVIPANLIIR